MIIFEAERSSYDGPDTGTYIRQYVNVGLKKVRKNLSIRCMTNLVFSKKLLFGKKIIGLLWFDRKNLFNYEQYMNVGQKKMSNY